MLVIILSAVEKCIKDVQLITSYKSTCFYYRVIIIQVIVSPLLVGLLD